MTTPTTAEPTDEELGRAEAERDAALAKCRELEEHINRASGVVQ